MAEVFSIKIGGEAGQGVKSFGLNIARLATRSGYQIFTYSEYPSLIRGGHNVVQIVFSQEGVTSPVEAVNFLVALDKKTIGYHVKELVDGAGIIYDADSQIETAGLERFRLFPVPLKKLAKEAGGNDITSNTVAAGALIGLLGGDMGKFFEIIKETLGSKDENIALINQRAAQDGCDHIQKTFPGGFETLLAAKAEVASPKMVINGNQAVGYAAITAGVQFVSIYPMTPITALLEIFAKNQEKYGYIFRQPEDEIAAVNMAIGAGYAGARAMCATSGGGFCLMTEGYGLAGITETPLVIIEGMRGGPATGLPTWTEQGDLRFILHAHQSEFPRLVMAAGDAKEAFFLTMEAFNLAEKYQTPVVVIVDKMICECDQGMDEFGTEEYVIDRGKRVTGFDQDYKRYKMSEDGISNRALPGDGNFFVTNSDEHDEVGFSSEESDNRQGQMAKRMQKLVTVAKNEKIEPELYGPEDAELTIVSWGSTKGSILMALKELPGVNFLQLKWMNPFPVNKVREILGKAKMILDIETNSTAQAAGLIAEHTGIMIEHKLLKNDGRPIYPEEIVKKVKNILNQQ